jgi:hypothetical protein
MGGTHILSWSYRTETEVCVHSVEQAVGLGMYNKEKK